MTPVWISLAVGTVIFVAGLIGLFLQKLLPEPHTSERSRDMIGAIVGLFSLLLALVLGTLIGSVFSFYSTQKSELEAFASRAVHLDLELAEYGPETMSTRVKMKETLQGIHDMFWGKDVGEVDLESPKFTVGWKAFQDLP